MYELKDVDDPIAGGTSKRVVHKASNSIVVKRTECLKIANCIYQETKGDGAAKFINIVAYPVGSYKQTSIQ